MDLILHFYESVHHDIHIERNYVGGYFIERVGKINVLFKVVNVFKTQIEIWKYIQSD